MPQIVSFDEFRRRLGLEFAFETELSPTDHLVEDLSFDSFQMFQLSMLIELLSGCETSTELDGDLTVEGAYQLYAAQAALPDRRT